MPQYAYQKVIRFPYYFHVIKPSGRQYNSGPSIMVAPEQSVEPVYRLTDSMTILMRGVHSGKQRQKEKGDRPLRNCPVGPPVGGEETDSGGGVKTRG